MLNNTSFVGLKLWLLLGKVASQLAAQRDEIKFTDDRALDIEELLAATEDKIELDKVKEQSFEEKQKLEIQNEDLKKQLKDLEDKSKDTEAFVAKKLAGEEKRLRSKLEEEMEAKVAEETAAREEKIKQQEKALKEKEKQFTQEIKQLQKDLEDKDKLLADKTKAVEEVREELDANLKKIKEELHAKKQVRCCDDAILALMSLRDWIVGSGRSGCQEQGLDWREGECA